MVTRSGLLVNNGMMGPRKWTYALCLAEFSARVEITEPRVRRLQTDEQPAD